MLKKLINTGFGFAMLLMAGAANATTILDLSPDTIGNLNTAFTNISGSQNFVTRFTTASDFDLTGIDIYGDSSFGSVGSAVKIRIFNDGAGSPGPLSQEFDSLVSIKDSDGTSGFTILSRLHASFNHFLSAGSYWIGMSGVATLVQAEGPSISGSPTAQMSGTSFSFIRPGTSNIRLFGDEASVPEPATLLLLGLGLAGIGFSRRIAK